MSVADRRIDPDADLLAALRRDQIRLLEKLQGRSVPAERAAPERRLQEG